MWDAVIVGAGPAGSATALLLARAGFDVLLLDAREFPRPKPCGDCISPGANRLLRNLGVWDEILAQGPAVLGGWQLSCANTCFSAQFQNDISLAISRERLDAVLLRHARAAGVEVRTGTRVRRLVRSANTITGVATDHAEFRARVTIGADGLRSCVARELRAYTRTARIRKLSLTAHLRAIRHTTGVGEMHVHDNACLGIAPVENCDDALCNVTVVLRSGAHERGRPHDMMRAALRRMQRPDIAERVENHSQVLASGPFDWPVRRVWFDGAALVGDAAGYFDPFTGQGIYQALAGAHMLADAVQRTLRQGTVHQGGLMKYGAAHRQLTRSARHVQHMVDYVCSRPRLSARVFAALQRTPELGARLVAVTGDVRPARDLLSPPLLARFVAASLTWAVPA